MSETNSSKPVLPADETERALDLLSFDLDYRALEDDFDTLVSLAAQVTGTEISLLNLIDMYTQWTVSGHGYPAGLTPRENTVCQYTILEEDHFEVKDLQQDERFRDFSGIKDGNMLRYYMGVPLRTPAGHNIGVLCVMDSHEMALTPDQLEALHKIAAEIVKRLLIQKRIQDMERQLAEARALNKRVAHDVRGPIGGIVGLAQMLIRKQSSGSTDETLKIVRMIEKSATSLLGMADEIMQEKYALSVAAPEDGLTLQGFKSKLEEIFLPQAIDKGVAFDISINEEKAAIIFTKNKLLQVAVNLISNALKFTPPLGLVSVDIDLTFSQNHRVLFLKVSDTGIGLEPDQVQAIMSGNAASTSGTGGELGYGMGLQLVRQLLYSLHGSMQVDSVPGQGTSFELRIPIGTVNHLV
jgi:signal transduction histidine kinase